MRFSRGNRDIFVLRHSIYRIWPGHVRSQKAFDSWKNFSVIDVPAVHAVDADNLGSRQRACSQAHANALRLFLATNHNHCVVIEDDAVLLDHSWLSFTDYDCFIPFVSHRDETPGQDFQIRLSVLPRYGTQAYIASRRFAEAYIPLLESGGTADAVNLEACIGLRSASFASNAVIHDNDAISTISEPMRLASRRAREAGHLIEPMKHVPERYRSVSFCVLCKGRQHHLKQTLPENLDAIKDKHAEIVLVDYRSDDDLAEWLSKDLSQAIRSGKLQFYQLREDLPFSIPIGKNFAHRFARNQIIINLDADNFIGDLWIATQMLPYGEFLGCNMTKSGCFGRVGFWRNDLARLNGYDETFEAVAHHDTDLQKRAIGMGLIKRHWPCNRMPIQHDKADTMLFAGGGGRAAWLEMEKRNANRSRENLARGLFAANLMGLFPATFWHNFSSITVLPTDRFFSS